MPCFRHGFTEEAVDVFCTGSRTQLKHDHVVGSVPWAQGQAIIGRARQDKESASACGGDCRTRTFG